MRTKEIVEAVREEYPKFSPAALSLARRPLETGVTFVPGSAEIIEALGGPVSPYKRREERRVKCIGFRARLKPADAQRVKNEMARRGVTAQQLVEALLLAWADWSEKEPSTVGKTAGGSGDGIKADSTPKDNTKGGKTQ